MKGIAPKSNLRGDTFVLHGERGHGLILIHGGIVQHGVSDPNYVFCCIYLLVLQQIVDQKPFHNIFP